MQNTAIVDSIVAGLINTSKILLKGRYIQKQKVPFFTQNQTESINNIIMEQGGYQMPARKKYNHLDLSMDPMPIQKQADCLAPKSAQISHQYRQINRSYKSSNLKNKRLIRSQPKGYKNQINTSKKYSPSRIQKQNKFLKVSELQDNKIVLVRVKKREQQQQQRQRQQKRKQMLQQYQEQRSMQLFHQQRQEHQRRLSSRLDQHTSYGKKSKFTFGVDGELLLFKEDLQKTCKGKYPPEPIGFNIQQRTENEGQIENTFIRHESTYQKSQRMYHSTENQRIKSARGQAFSSSVLKTVNLSRMSMNRTMKDVDVEHFMRRNDLFNNNHSRQTTSIPYMKAQEGTVYKELGTNQVISAAQDQESKTAMDTRTNSAKTQSYFRRSSNFQVFPFTKNNNLNQKPSQSLKNKKEKKQQQATKIEERPIKTSERYQRSIEVQQRPSTSLQNGRITKMNPALAYNLLQ